MSFQNQTKKKNDELKQHFKDEYAQGRAGRTRNCKKRYAKKKKNNKQLRYRQKDLAGEGNHYMTDKEIHTELERILDSKPEGFEGCERFTTWRTVFDHEETSFYVGSTSRPIRKEAAFFLNRKTYWDGKKTYTFTPIVTYPDGKRIKGIREAEDEFGFMFVPFFKNVSMYNCVRLEWALQRKYDFLSRNGRRRLWLVSGKGSEYQDVYGFCLTYISLSFDLQQALDSGRLIRGKKSLTVAYDKKMKHGAYYKAGDEAEDEYETDDDSSE